MAGAALAADLESFDEGLVRLTERFLEERMARLRHASQILEELEFEPYEPDE